jgi:hypothetical protein
VETLIPISSVQRAKYLGMRLFRNLAVCQSDRCRYYTWSPYPIDTTLEFVPMLHSEGNVDSFTSTIQRTIDKQKVKNVLGMNEYALSLSKTHSFAPALTVSITGRN